MAAFTKNMFESDLARHYDAMHLHRNYGQECDFAHDVIQRYYPGAKRVLDVCCGTGEHAVRMAQQEYDVTGIDASPDMINVAEEKAIREGVSVDFRCLDLRNLDTVGEFQAAYCLGYTLHYMTTYPEVTNFFTTINGALLAPGVFLVDFINGWSLIEGLQRDKFVYQHEDTTIYHFEQTSLHKKERVRHVEFYYFIDHHDGHMKTISAEEDLRIFFDDEVQMLLANCGFDSVRSFGDYAVDTTASDAPNTVAVVGQKRATSPT